MSNWYMLTILGKDQAGIVATITQQLYQSGANLGEAQMQRMGAYFAIMLMVDYSGTEAELQATLKPSLDQLGLRVHIDAIEGQLHQHREPNVSVHFYGADQVGIVAKVTDSLSKAGLHILDLQTDVGGTPDKPIFIMQIEGFAEQGIEALTQAAVNLREFNIRIDPIDTLMA